MPIRKPKTLMETTDSSKVYRMARKYYLASSSKDGISCTFCPYHAKENSEHNLQKSWKKFRKTQYRKEFSND